MKRKLAALAALISLALVLTLTSVAQDTKTAEPAKPCLLVRPTEGIQTAFGRVGGKYEYLDSFGMTDTKINYSKRDLEKLQQKGVHIVVVQRDAKRDEVKQARESCTN